ncbi:acyltransferase [Serratia marcescens]|uniref:acyltransferase family protein n=1 Tax=Serratia sp. BFP-2025 TaxID=3433707 RepID=UPI003D7DBB07|nr:acyltransferase [Serratia marcescens]
MKKTLNPWLDLCRSAAIIMVIFSHGRTFLLAAFPSAQTFKFGGFLGVELFFVLSGFLIGRIIFEKVKESSTPLGWIPAFWFRRWMRTYPSYLLFLLLNLFLINNIRPEAPPNILAFSTFTQSLVHPHPAFFGEAWSLAVEEVFYFLFPIVIAVFLFIVRDKKVSILLAIAAMILFSFLFRVNATMNAQQTFNEIRSTSLYRLDSLMIGVIFSWLFVSNKINRLSWIGLLLIPIAIAIASQPDVFMDESRFLKIFLFDIANVGFACLITTFYHVDLPNLMKAVTARIARWSYAAYLTNLPVLIALNHYLPKPDSTVGCLAMWSLFIALTMLSAKLVYELFEVKILRLRDRLKSA